MVSMRQELRTQQTYSLFASPCQGAQVGGLKTRGWEGGLESSRGLLSLDLLTPMMGTLLALLAGSLNSPHVASLQAARASCRCLASLTVLLGTKVMRPSTSQCLRISLSFLTCIF